MDDIVAALRHSFEGQIDFEGQKQAERVNFAAITVISACALLHGLATKNPYNVLKTALAGFVVTAVTVIPPWPWWRRHPVKWLHPSAAELEQELLARAAGVGPEVLPKSDNTDAADRGDGDDCVG